jgi:hypothetical protein
MVVGADHRADRRRDFRAWLYDAFVNKHHVAPEAGR